MAFVTFALVCTMASPLRGSDEWVLTTADFRSERVSLRGIGEQGFSVHGADGKMRTIEFDQMLQIDRGGAALSKPAPARFILSLSGGERIAGEPKGLEGENLVWSTAALGEITVPLSRVSSLVRATRNVESAVRGARANEDVITLANGDTIRGIVANITAKYIAIQSAAGDVTEIPLDSIAAVSFAVVAGGADAAPDASARAFRVSLSDSTTITAPSVRTAGDRLTMTLADSSERIIPLASVTSIEQVNGPVVWLSSKAPVESLQIPFLGQPAPARMNQSVTGEPIQFGARTYARGIGVHAYSRLVWEIDPGYEAFRTQYAIDGQLPYANVTVRIRLDDRVVHEQTDFRAGVLAPLIVLGTNGAKTITLEVDYGDTYDVQDRFNWIEPALLKDKPKPPAPPKPQPPTTAPAPAPAPAPGTQPGA